MSNYKAARDLEPGDKVILDETGETKTVRRVTNGVILGCVNVEFDGGGWSEARRSLKIELAA
jgi:hypothetical protein